MLIREVPADKLISKVAEKLKKIESIKPHPQSVYIKSGVCAERPPVQPDFWYIRSAALLRRIALRGPVGVQRLRTVFGSRKRRGHKPAHHRPVGGKFIRLMLQQLEQAGFIKKVEKPRKGRVLTPKGQAFLDRISKEMK